MGVNGDYCFTAEEAEATQVKGVDVFGPTPEFEQKKRERRGVLADAQVERSQPLEPPQPGLDATGGY